MLSDGATCSGAALVRNAMVARSMTDTIIMIGASGGVRPFGRDVRAWVGSPMTSSTRAARGQELAVIYARDPRLDAGSILVTIAATGAGSQYAFTIDVSARTTSGVPIAMVMAISAITVDILAQQGGAS